MFDLSPITGLWHANLRSKVFPATKTMDTINFKPMRREIAAYRWLIFPVFDVALLLLAMQSLGPVDPESGHRPMDATFLSLAFAAIGVLRLVFLIFDLKYWFDVIIRNETAHKLLRRKVEFPIDPKSEDRIDKSRTLTIDGTAYLAEAVRGVEITGIAFAHASAIVDPAADFIVQRDVSKAGTAMVGDRQCVPLDEKGKELPLPWATEETALAPIYSPTLVFRDWACQLFNTRDLYEAIDFTRRLRHALSLRGPLRLLGLHPFVLKQNRSLHATLYPLIAILVYVGSLILEMLWLRAPSPTPSLLSVPAYYLAQEGLMLLCRISIRPVAAQKGQDNVVWLNSKIVDLH